MIKTNSVKITVKYSGKCFECREYILKGNSALWYKKIGIKCIECATQFIPDDSKLIIIEPDEEFYLK